MYVIIYKIFGVMVLEIYMDGVAIMGKAVACGILSSLFFAFTFVLNRSMNLSGGTYLWSAALRYIFMLPILYTLVKFNKGTKKVYNSIRMYPKGWFIWSIIGFGMFYLPLSFVSNYGPSWFAAGSWQITIVAGVLLTPLWGQKLPIKNLILSCVILVGVFILTYENSTDIKTTQSIVCTVAILIAAFSYPLGNRKMMDICDQKLNTTERVFGMTLCSMPFWVLVAFFAFGDSGLPSLLQIIQSLFVAIFSGVVATILFFRATNMIKDNIKYLAVVEATQSFEVIFTLLGGLLFLGDPSPTWLGIIGLIFIVLGMALNSLFSRTNQ
jgi:drug/metabolite transporter (DMT)-like permease